MSDRPRYVLTLSALPDPEGVPPINRLRQLLKRALRQYKLRCTDCKELASDEAEKTAQNPTDEGGEGR